MSEQHSEELAQALHSAWASFRAANYSVFEPRWFALADEYKEPFREMAERLIRERCS